MSTTSTTSTTSTGSTASTASTRTPDAGTYRARRARPTRRRLVAVPAAAAVGLVVWLVAVPVLGVELTARSGGDEIAVGPPSVAVAGLAAALGGWALLAALERLTASARRAWTTTAVVVLGLSLGGPLVQATSGAAAATLVAMHLAVGASVILLLRRTARSAPPAG